MRKSFRQEDLKFLDSLSAINIKIYSNYNNADRSYWHGIFS